MTSILLLAGLFASPAAAQTHGLSVRVSDGKTSYVQNLKLSEDSQANSVGQVTGKDGSRRDMIVNALLTRAGGSLSLQYQLELSPGRGVQGRSVQAQGQLSLLPGASLTVVECGPWKVDIGLDAAKKGPAPWEAAGRGNLRVGAELSGGASRFRARQVLQPGTQGNIVDGLTRGGRKYGFIMNLLPSVQRRETVRLQYQLEYTPLGGRPLQLQNQETLAIGRKSSSQSSGYDLDLLVEGAPAAPGDGTEKGGRPSREPAPPAAEKSTVPLLR